MARPLTFELILAIFATSFMCTSTIVSAINYDPEIDARALNSTLENDDYSVMSQRIIDHFVRDKTRAQRLWIIEFYMAIYDKNLTYELEKRTSGEFRDAILALTKTLPQLYADTLWYIPTEYTDATTFINYLEPLVEDGLEPISVALKERHGKTLEEFIKTSLTWPTDKNTLRDEGWDLLRGIVEGIRDKDTQINKNEATEDVNVLLRFKLDKRGKKPKDFLPALEPILTTKSYPQLRMIFKLFEQRRDTTLLDTMQTFLPDEDYQKYKVFAYCASAKSTFFAMRLKWSMRGSGTAEWLLNSILIGRSDIDIEDIKKGYIEMFTSLEADIRDDTSGSYRDLLLALIRV